VSTAAVVAEVGVRGYPGHGVVVGVDHGGLVEGLEERAEGRLRWVFADRYLR